MNPIRFKRPRPMTSGGTYRETRCGTYRLYESVLGGWSAGVRGVDGVWRPLERRDNGTVRWRRKKSAAIRAIERHARELAKPYRLERTPKQTKKRPRRTAPRSAAPAPVTQRNLF